MISTAPEDWQDALASVASASNVAWLEGAPVWYALVSGQLVFVTGGGEQNLAAAAYDTEGLHEQLEVILRSKESRARVLHFVAETQVIEPDSQLWHDAAAALAATRQNATLRSDELIQHWAEYAWLVALTPIHYLEGPGGYFEAADRVTVVSAAVATTATAPRHLGGRPSVRLRQRSASDH